MTFSGADEVLAWMARAANWERQAHVPGGFRLDRMRAIVEALGRPDRAWRAVHVAGTKGKGTTCAAAASVLDAAGLRVGLYTSPHLVDPRERIRVGARPADDALWADAAAALEAAAGRAAPPVGDEQGPTWFELCTALCLELFRRAERDVGVIEVGLGGRLDATNVLDPAVCVITRIARDHQALLGATTRLIAGEKAAIIKPAVAAVAGPHDADATEVVVARAAAMSAPLWLLGRDLRVDDLRELPGGAVACRVVTPRATHELPRVPVAAACAADVALALAACERLGVDVRAAAPAGAARLRWRGRWDVLPGDPAVVVDGAHDEASFEALRATAQARLARPPVLLLGASRDKDLPALLDVLGAWPGVEAVTTAADHARAAPAVDLARGLAVRGVPATAVEGAAAALAAAEGRARARGSAVLVLGSLFLAGEVLALRGEEALAAWTV